jgi:hypothetical protein
MSWNEPAEGFPLPPPPPPPEEEPRPRRRHPVRAGLIAAAVLAAAFGAYRFLGDREFDRAVAAHRAGECQEAVDRYARVTGLYRFAGNGSMDAARTGSAECALFLRAERVPASDFPGTTSNYRSFLAKYSDGPLASLARERLSSAYVGWGDQQTGEGDYEAGIGKYATVAEEFDGTAGAARADSSVLRLLAGAEPQASKDGTACGAVEILETLIDNDLHADEARRPLPTAYYHCGRSEFRNHDDSAAIDHLTALIEGFRKDPLVPRARALLVDVRVDLYSGGNTGRLESPGRVGSSGSGSVIVEIQNSSPDRVEVLFSGPESKSVIVGKCSSCAVYSRGEEPAFCPEVGPTVEITLKPGTYEVVIHNPDSTSTRDAYGKWSLASGARYFNCQILIEGG